MIRLAFCCFPVIFPLFSRYFRCHFPLFWVPFPASLGQGRGGAPRAGLWGEQGRGRGGSPAPWGSGEWPGKADSTCTREPRAGVKIALGAPQLLRCEMFLSTEEDNINWDHHIVGEWEHLFIITNYDPSATAGFSSVLHSLKSPTGRGAHRAEGTVWPCCRAQGQMRGDTLDLLWRNLGQERSNKFTRRHRDKSGGQGRRNRMHEKNFQLNLLQFSSHHVKKTKTKHKNMQVLTPTLHITRNPGFFNFFLAGYLLGSLIQLHLPG